MARQKPTRVQRLDRIHDWKCPKNIKNQKSIEQTLAAMSIKVAATNTFVEQVASMQEKISQALATTSKIIHILAEENEEMLRT